MNIETYNKTVLIGHSTYFCLIIGLVGQVFANGPGDWGSIPDRVIPKT